LYTEVVGEQLVEPAELTRVRELAMQRDQLVDGDSVVGGSVIASA
jgi:hypothetical protein